jgi:serine/threonine-protein kinase
MLLDEARIAVRIHHPNVVGIQEVNESDEHGYYLVMDYVEGFSLWDVAQRAEIPLATRWRVVHRVLLDTLAGLEAAHRTTDDDGRLLDVVHRDVSPQNVLIGVDGVARVTDFGIAKAAARLTSTRTGQVKGKVAYMAPEQARGRKVDPRTDVFSVGIILWEALTGQRLFKRENEAETYSRVVAMPIPRVRTLVPDVPEAVEVVCARALERDPAQRFPTARQMAAALEEAARGHKLLADAYEVGAAIGAAFGTQLAARRQAVRATGTTEPPPSG